MRWSDKILAGSVGYIALLAGVKADTIWSTETLPASTIWSTMWSTVTSYVTKTLPASTVSVPYTVTTSVEYKETTTITVTSISISVVTSVATQYSEKDFTTTLVQPTTVTDFVTIETPTTVTDFVTEESPTTVTDFITKESPTTITDFVTQESPTTVTDFITKESPTTVTDFVTQESPTTVTDFVTEETPTTVTDFVTKESPTTVTDFVTEESPTTVTDFITQESLTTVTKPTTITVPVTIPTTVPTTIVESVTVTSTPLTGIVLCPSRTVNPTYTTSNIPADYIWGCPAGTVCTPPKIDCNFEQNPPADTYYCSPDECEPIKPETVPELNAFEASAGDACGPYPTISDEPFNFNPSSFGLLYTIFECGGCWAETCTECSTIATKTETDVETEIDYQTVTDFITVIASTTTQAPKPYSKTSAWASKAKRQQSPLPQACYRDCNNCLNIAVADGKPDDCSAGSPFSNAYHNCNTCIGNNRGGPTNAADILISLAQFTSYCASHAKRGVQFTLNGPLDTPATATAPATTPRAQLIRGRRHAVY